MRVYDVYLKTADGLEWWASFAWLMHAERFKREQSNPREWVIREKDVPTKTPAA